MSNKKVLVPVWVLKQKVETDFEEYMFFHADDDGYEQREETFPLYDSTQEIIKILSEEGIEFDTSTGLWKE